MTEAEIFAALDDYRNTCIRSGSYIAETAAPARQATIAAATERELEARREVVYRIRVALKEREGIA